MFRSASVLPTAFESSPTICTRKRFSAIPYSFTSSLRDFPDLESSFDLSFFAKQIFVKGRRTRIPTRRVMIPTGRNEKNPNASKPFLASSSLTTRFGGVPMRVIIPPMLLANASGMRRRRDDVPAAAAILTTIGSIKATVPVLLTNIPMADVTIMTRRKRRSSLFPASTITLLPIIFARPVWKIPPPTMNRPTIMMTVVFEKPARPSAGVRICERSNARRAHIATRSDLTLPLTKKNAAKSNIISVVIISLYSVKGRQR